MAQHQTQARRLGSCAAQLPFGPGHLVGGHGGGGGIPHQQEQVVLAHAVGEGELGDIHEGQSQGVPLAPPVARGLLPIELERIPPARTGRGGIVIAHRDRHRQPRPPQGRQQLAVEGGPHGAQVHPAEPLFLSGHHVAAAEHQIGLPAGDQFDSPQHLRQVAGGAIAAVEIADGHQAQVAPGGWQQRPGAFRAGGGWPGSQAGDGPGPKGQPRQPQNITPLQRGPGPLIHGMVCWRRSGPCLAPGARAMQSGCQAPEQGAVGRGAHHAQHCQGHAEWAVGDAHGVGAAAVPTLAGRCGSLPADPETAEITP